MLTICGHYENYGDVQLIKNIINGILPAVMGRVAATS
jgi:chromate transport protein ChrA